MNPGLAVDTSRAARYHGFPVPEYKAMIDEAPSIQHRSVVRPTAAQVAALRGTPTGFLVAATGSYTGCAVTGDLVLGMARNCGAVGFVTDGCVRRIGNPTPRKPGEAAVGQVIRLC